MTEESPGPEKLKMILYPDMSDPPLLPFFIRFGHILKDFCQYLSSKVLSSLDIGIYAYCRLEGSLRPIPEH